MTTLFQNQSRVLIDIFYINNKIRRLYFEKTFCYANKRDQYFLKLYSIDYNGTYYCDGYIYFYLDDFKKESSFIGLYIKPEYRNMGLASLLIANWLKICMDNGFYNFTTNKKQRKPFLIYLLKKMGFEIEDTEKYNLSDFTIKLYQKHLDNNKYLKFKSSRFAAIFMNSTIALEDNYHLIPESSEEFDYLDQVLQSNIYALQDSNEAYIRSRKKIDNYK